MNAISISQDELENYVEGWSNLHKDYKPYS
jgi:hypothetical protein